jgi:acetolactate decarboxylase
MFDATLAAAAHGHITQIDTVTDLFRAHYEAHTTVAEAFADFTVGLGVAEACDGEIVACDHTVWRVPADGVPIIADPELGLPFAVVAHGGRPMVHALPAGADLDGIRDLISTVLANEPSLVAAVRIDGTFTNVVLRSEHRQSPPYPPLPDVLSHEVQFAFDEWRGTFVGFQFPNEDNGVTIPGLHLHGISADRRSGGHCHTFTVTAGEVTIWLDDVEIRVPHPIVTSTLQAHQLLDEVRRIGAPGQVTLAEQYIQQLQVSPQDADILNAVGLLHDAAMHDPYLTRET